MLGFGAQHGGMVELLGWLGVTAYACLTYLLTFLQGVERFTLHGKTAPPKQ